MRYLIRRLIFYVITAWAALSLNFLIPRAMPGNPAQLLMTRYQGRLSPDSSHAFATLFGLSDRSLLSQYWSYWVTLAHGNLGISINYFPTPVSAVIRNTLPWTVALVGVTTIISFVAGTLIGIAIGWRRGSKWLDALVPVTTFLSAVPYFWFGLLCVYVLAVRLRWFPVSGGYAYTTTIGLSWSFISSALYHAVLPAITIVLTSIAGWILGMRNMMVTTLSEDYVVMAEAAGLSDRRVKFSYAARNAILPSVASFGLSLGFVVSGALLVEIIFSYPGIGYALYQAVTSADYPLMQGIFLLITIGVLLANFAMDLVYVVVDPRTARSG